MKNKRLLSLVLCICLTASLFVGIAGTAASADGFTNGGYTYVYTVNANGTTVSSICKAFSLPYPACADAIRILNGWSSIPESLNAGTQVLLPNGATVAEWIKNGTIKIDNSYVAPATPTNTNTTTTNKLMPGDSVSYYIVPHTVASGETLYSISNAMGVSYNTYSNLILNMSGIQNVNNIKAGKVVYIPTLKAPTSGTFYAVIAHKVQSGETLTSICTNYGIKYESFYQVIAGLNDGLNLNYIKAGNTVYIPTASSVVTPTAAPVKPTATPAPTATPTAAPETGYAISFINADYGTPAASVDGTVVTRADAGKTVTILPNCKAGYAVQSIKVIRADNNSEIPTSNNSFTMPAIGVKITVTYAKGEYSINCITTTHGTYNVLVSGTDGDCANYGDEISVIINADPGFVVDKVTYQKNNNKISAVEVEDENNDGIYKFMMPKYNTNVNVVFKQATYKKLHDAEMEIIGASMLGLPKEQFKVSYEVDGQKISGNLAPVGAIITMKVTVPAGGTVEEILINNDKNITVTDLGNSTFTFKMPDVDSTVKVYVADDSNRTAYKLSTVIHSSTSFVLLTVTDAESGKVITEAKTAKPGDKVSIVAYPLDYYKYVTSAATGGAIVQNDGSNDYFIMPAGDVKVTPTFVYDGVKKYGLQKCDSNTWSFSAYGKDGTEKYCFEAGEKVTIIAHPADGYKLQSATYNYNHVYTVWGMYLWEQYEKNSASVSNNTFTFTMPAAYVDLTLNFTQSAADYAKITTEAYSEDGVMDSALGQAYPLVNGSQPSRISTNTWSVQTGSTVTFDIRPATIEGVEYEVKKVQIVNSSLTSKYFGAKTIKPDANGVYAYTVLGGDKDLSAGLILKVTYGPKKDTAKKYNVLYAAPEDEKCMYSFTVEDLEGNEVLSKTSGAIKVEAGKYVTVHIPKTTGYKFSKLYIDETDRIPEAGSGEDEFKYTFLMPEHDVKTEVIFERNDIYRINRLAVDTISIDSVDVEPGTFNIQVLDGINPSTAHSGDTVKIMPKPAEGFVVDESKSYVFYEDGGNDWHYFDNNQAPSNPKINKGSDGAYTFVMPKDDVDIKVVYKLGTFKIDASQVKEADKALITVLAGTGTFDPTTYLSDADIPMGTEVKFDVAPNTEVAIAEDQVFVNDTNIPLVEGTPSEKPYMIKNGTGYTVCFDMPGKDAVIRIGTKGLSHNIFKEDPALFEYCPALEDTGKTVEFALTIPSGKRVSKISYTEVNEDGSDKGGATVDIYDAHDEDIQPETARPVRDGAYDAVIGKGTINNMPNSAIKIHVEYEYALNFKYNTQVGDVKANTAAYADVKFAPAGDTVTVNAVIKDEYKSNYRIANMKVVFDDETLANRVQDLLTNTPPRSFTMEASSATVYVDFLPNDSRYVIMDGFTGNENATVKINGNVVSEGKTSYAFAPGETVKVVVTPNSGYVLPNKYDSVTFTPTGLEYSKNMDGSSYVFTFKMPSANDVIFKVDPAERAYNISASVPTGGGELKLLEDPNGNEITGKVFAGATVYARVKATKEWYAEYTLQNLYYTDTNGNPVYITSTPQVINGYTYYKFTMPAYDTTVVATFKPTTELRTLTFPTEATVTASGNSVTSGKALAIGTTVNYEITVPTDKSLGMVRIRYTVDGVNYQNTDLGNALTGSFSMPYCAANTKVELQVELVNAPKTFAVNLKDPAPEGVQVRFSTDSTADFDSAEASLTDIAASTPVYVFAKPDEGYNVDSSFAVNGTPSGTFSNMGSYWRGGPFAMPGEPVFVTVTSSATAVHKISKDLPAGVDVIVAEEAAKDTDVTVSIPTAPAAGKHFVWQAWKGEETTPFATGKTGETFKMPDADVTIRVIEEAATAYAITVKDTGSGENLEGVTADPTSAYKGQVVNLKFSGTGHLKGKNVQLKVTNAAETQILCMIPNDYSTVEVKDDVFASFVMPAEEEVHVIWTYDEAHLYNIVRGEGAELFDSSTPATAAYGDSVTINLVDPGITGYANEYVFDGYDYDSGDSFSMPAEDVVLTAKTVVRTYNTVTTGVPIGATVTELPGYVYYTDTAVRLVISGIELEADSVKINGITLTTAQFKSDEYVGSPSWVYVYEFDVADFIADNTVTSLEVTATAA